MSVPKHETDTLLDDGEPGKDFPFGSILLVSK